MDSETSYTLASMSKTVVILMRICDALRDLVPFIQFEKREKHSWWSVNFTKINTPPWVFSRF